jgi:hypothetical protein
MHQRHLTAEPTSLVRPTGVMSAVVTRTQFRALNGHILCLSKCKATLRSQIICEHKPSQFHFWTLGIYIHILDDLCSGKSASPCLGPQSSYVGLNFFVRWFWVEDGLSVLTIVLVLHLKHALESKPGDCKS